MKALLLFQLLLVPQAPKGHKWKEIRQDNTVTWLACWTENVQGQQKYVMLNPTSRLKGEKNWKEGGEGERF